jgi:signal transduction histidine kinase
VRLKFLPQALELEVEDHGKGFVAEPAATGNLPRGIGLVAMRERAELIGGQLDISRPAQGGTLVRLNISKDKLQTHAA